MKAWWWKFCRLYKQSKEGSILNIIAYTCIHDYTCTNVSSTYHAYHQIMQIFNTARNKVHNMDFFYEFQWFVCILYNVVYVPIKQVSSNTWIPVYKRAELTLLKYLQSFKISVDLIVSDSILSKTMPTKSPCCDASHRLTSTLLLPSWKYRVIHYHEKYYHCIAFSLALYLFFF